MIKKPKQPIKKWQNFVEFYQIHRNQSWLFNCDKSIVYPCLDCRDGMIYDPDDPPCSVEGNKFRDKIKCGRCNGSGIGLEEYWIRWYNDEEALFKKRNLELLRRMKLYLSIKNKLSSEELQFINFSEEEESY